MPQEGKTADMNIIEVSSGSNSVNVDDESTSTSQSNSSILDAEKESTGNAEKKSTSDTVRDVEIPVIKIKHALERMKTIRICSICHKTFKTARTLRQHHREKHKGECAVACSICGKQVTKRNVKRHMRTHKNSTQCKHCKQTYSRGVFKQHVRYCREHLVKKND